MTNWESDSARIIQSQINSQKQEEQREMNVLSQRRNHIRDLVQQNYQNEVLSGIRILDQYHIKEQLTEIRDQLWGGTISIYPTSFEQYFTTISPHIDINSTSDLQIINCINNVSRRHSAQYQLNNPKVPQLEEGTDDEGHYYCYIRCVSADITVTSDGKQLNISSECSIQNIDNQKPNEIQKKIKTALLNLCVEFKKREQETLKRPDLLKKFHKDDTPTPRSFLDKLLGR